MPKRQESRRRTGLSEEVSEDIIQKKLEEMMENVALTKTEQLFAKILFNVRYDINELKLELLKVFKPDENDKDLEDIVNGSFYT